MVAKKDFLKFNKKYLVIKQLHDYMYIYIQNSIYVYMSTSSLLYVLL